MRLIAGAVTALSITVPMNLWGTLGIDPGNAPRRALFAERFVFGLLDDAFDARFTGEQVPQIDQIANAEERASSAIAPASDAEERLSAEAPIAYSATRAALAPSPGGSDEDRQSADPPRNSGSPTDIDSHTAIYDIVAHTVYLPSGRRLEAHSGLGSRLDDPRFVHARGRGPTPPNVYGLALRESRFHGVRALRLIPVGDGEMFGRDGILAHTYMLGPSGQSNGCVVFSDYTAFLSAFLSGEVDRLVVVDHLASAPSRETASGQSSRGTKDFFRGS
jgi:hypothetical protein